VTIDEGTPGRDRWAVPVAAPRPILGRALGLVPSARLRALPSAGARALALGGARVRAAGRAVLDLVAPLALVARSVRALPARSSARSRERHLRAVVALTAAQRPSSRVGRPAGELVTAVIVTRDQPRHLDRLLRSLAGLGVPVVVVANAASPATRALLDLRPLVRTIDTPHLGYAAANNLGLAEVVTEWALLINDDVEPIGATWLDEMLEAATADTVAVGAQLVHARRGILGGPAVDLTVQHDGIVFDVTSAVPRPRHLGRGEAPEVSREADDVPAATGACLLVRTAAVRAVDGLDERYDFGAEDVDLCLRLADHGRVRVAHRAVLLHHEGATRLGGDRRARRHRQRANWRRFDDRHGPRLRREVALDRLAERRRWSHDPYRALVLGPLDDVVRERLAAAGVRAVGASGRDTPVDVVVVREPLATTAGEGTSVLDRTRLAPGRRDAAAVGLVIDLTDAERDAATVEDGSAASAAAGGASLERWAASGWFAHADLALVRDRKQSRRVAALDPTLPCRVVGGLEPADLAAAVEGLTTAPRWSLRIGAPDAASARRWGDGPFAAALARELRALGAVARVTPASGWGSVDATVDVVLRLRGRGSGPRASGQRDVLWVMSHPEEVSDAELDAADLVLGASVRLARELGRRTTTPVHVLPQGADGRRFSPGEPDPALATDVLFVGNSRGVARPVVLAAIAARLPLTIIGGDWRPFVPGRYLAARRVEGDELAGRYRSAAVVLNDHWEDMRRHGIVSNRVLDVLACGGCVVSDDVVDVGRLLGRAVVTCAGPEEVGPTVRRLLDDPAERRRLGELGARVVREGHLLEHRAAELVRLVDELERASRPRRRAAPGPRRARG
jgi:GT2 family glycosyltransferase